MRSATALRASGSTYLRLRAVVGRFLRADVRTLDGYTPLTAYGLDSLSALELIAILEDEFSCELPEWLLTDSPDLVSLASVIDGDTAGTQRDAQFLRDARLPLDVRPARVFEAREQRRVLLTGATGFLGAYLIRTLLDETTAEIVCLTRASGIPSADRIRRNLETYGLWTSEAAMRVRSVDGDLAAGALGLDRQMHAELADTIDVVYHAGADVNWVTSYGGLRQTNVAGTCELLRLACAGRPKAFQFVSSLSVCYAVGGPAVVTEVTDMLPFAGRLTLGYAQSKCVAESLVRQAAARGLPATVIRPSLIVGDSVTGAATLDDLMATLLKGCIQMGAAPDLDWVFDAVPVDVVAQAIVRAARRPAPGLQAYHLSHPRPRHWRECVLWTNLFGYPVILEPYSTWLERLRKCGSDAGHPLHGLRSFFLRPVAGRTAPEHLESHNRSRVDCSRARRLEADCDVTYPALDAELFDRYFQHYIRRGHLPEPPRPAVATARTPVAATWDTPEYFEHVLREHFGDQAIRVTSLQRLDRGSEHSVIGEMTSWRRKCRTGLFDYRVGYQAGPAMRELDVVVKVKPADDDVLEVAEATAAMCDDGVSRALGAVRDQIGVAGSHLREVEIYAHADARLRRHMPVCYATWRHDTESSWGVVLERLRDMEIMNAADSVAPWHDEAIAAASEGLAAIHAVWLGRHTELSGQPWIGHVTTSQNVGRLVPFWRALASHAADQFRRWAGPSLVRTHRTLVDTVPRWWPALEALPQTLIHNDFNPRNVGLRRQAGQLHLVAYDWELATIGAPQRDLAEFLCFVLPDDVGAERLADLLEDHRRRLERAAGVSLDARAWTEGFASALADLLVARLSFYALITRVRPQLFLPRVVRAWWRLHQLCERPSQ
ncbi:MAG: thioester reductase domain-containing protein [Vicinamibacteria bacterium]|nr:thioester reductase domain-containing protein [Vicinamibacteria bacterium]